MIPETHPLIETATEPLEDNAEQRLVATAMLREIAKPDHPDAEAVVSRWRLFDSRKHPYLWIGVLYVLAGASLLFSTGLVKKITEIYQDIDAVASFDQVQASGNHEGLTDEEMLLLGDPSLSKLEQTEALLRSDPEAPAFYSEYAYEYARGNGTLPPDYLDKAARLDPENAFFRYIAAGRLGEEAIEKIAVPYGGASKTERIRDGMELRPIPDEIKWKVVDAVAFEEAMDLISEAATLGNFDSYETMMLGERLKLFPQEKMLEKIRALAFAESDHSNHLDSEDCGHSLGQCLSPLGRR